MNTLEATVMPRSLAVFALLALVTACAPQVVRGGHGTENPKLDERALGVGLDREDINYLVSQNIASLEASRFWKNDVEPANPAPVVAIWPIENRTTQHIEDQLATILSSIETSFVNSGQVRVVARNEQENLIDEIQRQGSPMFDRKTQQRAGRQLGAQYFVTGRITSVDEKLSNVRRLQYSLFLQVLEIETGLVKWQHEVTRSKEMKR